MSEALVNDAALGTNAAGEDLVSGGGPIVSIGTQDVGSGFSRTEDVGSGFSCTEDVGSGFSRIEHVGSGFSCTEDVGSGFSRIERVGSGFSRIVSIGSTPLEMPLGIAPMAGMTDSAFRRLVKRHGGCGLVVTEMVSSEGLVRGIDRTLEYAEYTTEERPISIQIFGGDPAKMADAAQIVEAMGADIVDVNMGCPVPKIAKHNAGCSLMREPGHAASVIAAMAKAVKIPVTVKMRAGWNDEDRNAPILAKMVEDAGARAVTIHGRTAAQSYSGTADWDLVARVADLLTIPVFGSGDCVTPEQIVARLASGVEGVLVGRGVLRNPWILAQAADLLAGRPARVVTLAERGQFLLDYIESLLHERVHDSAGSDVGSGFSRIAPSQSVASKSHDRWVVNKIRALGSYYTKGVENGSELRSGLNSAGSLDELRDLIDRFFFSPASI